MLHGARVDVVTLCEEHYHPGLGALVNSLVAAGFEGVVHVGHRGPAPGWRLDGRVPGVHVVFEPVAPGRHLSNHKPVFVRQVLASAPPEVAGVAYLDPDIVIRHPWAFFAEWVARGVALCADVNPWFPASHPVRAAWRALARELGDTVDPRGPELYVNAGFVGVSRERATFLDTWDRYLVAMAQRGPGLGHGPTGRPEPGPIAGRTSPFDTPDQDALNLAAMAHADAVSLMGPQAMGFAPGWPLMTHAIGAPKPWDRPLVRDALRGRPPSRADLDFLAHARGPIAVYAPRELARRAARLRAARLIASVRPRS